MWCLITAITLPINLFGSNHPIKNFLSSLQPSKIKEIYLQLGKDPTIRHLERLKKFVADEFIKKCPWAPKT